VYPEPTTELWIELPGGGGMGDPRRRPVEAVAADVRAGLVSPDRALTDYGVDVSQAPSGSPLAS
ncbi:MAG: hypothetical protein ACREOS_06375, partial [Candidatus Dormibacteraceae bacterium]